MIEAVIFDWGGTLTPWKTVDPHDAWQVYARILHADDDELAATAAKALADADSARWMAVRDEHRAFTIADVLADAGLTPASHAAPAHDAPAHDTAPGAPPSHAGPGAHGPAMDAYRDFWVQATHTDPEAQPMLTALRERGLRLGVLSSTPWPAQWHEDWLRRDGVLDAFDALVWSSDLPFTKPHPSAFHAAMEAVGITDPARCVYVGDRPYDDISGAKSVGMRAVLVPHSDIPLVQQVPVDVHPDGVIQRLSDLPDLVAGW